jgi:hypothetical protein
MRYTRKIHARRLAQMLNREDPCGCCPAAREFDNRSLPHEMWEGPFREVCNTCRTFVDLPPLRDNVPSDRRCPCSILGKSQAIQTTLKVLESYRKEQQK